MANHTERDGRRRWSTGTRTPGYQPRHAKPEPVTAQTVIIPAVRDDAITGELQPVPA